MSYNLDKRVEREIIGLAKEHGLQKVILYGSRARGTNNPRSDIDLAVRGGNVQDFYFDVEEKTWTLLFFDVVDLDRTLSPEFLAEIERDGVVLYEKV
ncbi:MAG: nucleotidyltransferase domain-containing protein [Selenomonadaceae bacterium]|nr:nucleotidyltransferase domain-containing protein [Selenomonadaceae bacterium]